MLFVRSYAISRKVKRMRNNPHVRITPSDALGWHHGVAIDGTALRVDGDKEIRISQRSWVKVTENHRQNQMPQIRFCSKDSLRHLLALFSNSHTRPSQLLCHKCGLMKISFDLWGAIKQLDWAVFAIKI